MDRRFFALCSLAPCLVLVCMGCPEKTEAPEPTEPWPADRASSSNGIDPDSTATTNRLVFDVSDASLFQLRLPAKEAKPTATIGGLGGAFTVDANRLENTRGTVLFDLLTLNVNGDGDGGGPDAQRSEWARSWLGLGNDVAAETRARLRYGRYEVDAIHDLTATRLERGSARGASTQHVQGNAVGRLVLRNLSVARRVPIEITFQWPDGAARDASPSKVSVRLRSVESVPLAEHAIVPRDSSGREQPEDLPLLGRVVGKAALVQGEIALLPRLL